MANFFSLQPQQTDESNLSKFASGNPALEHVGSSQSFLDPSLGGGETLHSPFEDEPGNSFTSGTKGGSGNLMAPTGDDSGSSVQPGGTSSTTGSRTPQRPQQPQGSSGMSMSPEQIQALQTIGSVQQGISAVPNSAFEMVKSWVKSNPETSSYSDTEIEKFIQSLNDPGMYQTGGLLEGNQNLYESLNPSMTEGYDLGDTNLDTSWLNEYTGTRSGDTSKSTLDKFALGDVQSALGIGSAAVTGDPAAILASLNRAAPTVAKYITDNQNILKDVGSIASVAGGAWSLYQGIQSNNPNQIAGGLGQLLQGAGTSRVGLDILSQLTGASAPAISTAFSAVGGLTGAFSLYQAIESGDPVQALLSAASIYGSLSTIAPTVFTPLTTLAGQALSAVAPGVASALGIGAGTVAGLGASTGGGAVSAALVGTGAASGATPALAAAAGPILGVAAVVVMAVVSWISANEESEARRSGWWNNPIKGELYSSATAGVATANQVLDNINQVGITSIPTEDLTQVLPMLFGSLQPYYATAQGGAGAIKASDSVVGGNTELGSPDQYTARFTQAKAGLESIVDELLKRGMTFDQIAQIPVQGNWTLESLDAGGTPNDYLARSPKLSQYMSEGGGLYGTLGYAPAPGQNQQNQVDILLRQALGSSMLAPDKATNASGLYNEMYGGPLAAAYARMGGGGEFGKQVLSNFDPWAIARTWAPGSRAQEHHVTDYYGNPLNPDEWGVYGTA